LGGGLVSQEGIVIKIKGLGRGLSARRGFGERDLLARKGACRRGYEGRGQLLGKGAWWAWEWSCSEK